VTREVRDFLVPSQFQKQFLGLHLHRFLCQTCRSHYRHKIIADQTGDRCTTVPPAKSTL